LSLTSASAGQRGHRCQCADAVVQCLAAAAGNSLISAHARLKNPAVAAHAGAVDGSATLARHLDTMCSSDDPELVYAGLLGSCASLAVGHVPALGTFDARTPARRLHAGCHARAAVRRRLSASDHQSVATDVERAAPEHAARGRGSRKSVALAIDAVERTSVCLFVGTQTPATAAIAVHGAIPVALTLSFAG
jgi:hypothetical protein